MVAHRLVNDYVQALRAFLAGQGEAALSRAYELGREAVAHGIGVVDFVLLHNAALGHVAPVPAGDADGKTVAFLAESLSPFEMTHRGFQEAATRLEQVNRTLQRQNAECSRRPPARFASPERRPRRPTVQLEAFSYSVSHDLRAPLRGIDGFSQALLEDHAETLNEKGRDYLRRVRKAAQRMGQLIDDLLQLSRVARSELTRRPIDLSEIVREVAAELESRAREPRAVLAIEAGVVADADDRLVRIVLENLLGNAWKFTARAPERRISFGTDQRDGAAVYFVRDNGAGFDMAYVDRLFSPFQRLHSDAEFSGTGIGLATVRRIIRRHGGRVWAEGAVGQGATIFFTLGPKPGLAPASGGSVTAGRVP